MLILKIHQDDARKLIKFFNTKHTGIRYNYDGDSYIIYNENDDLIEDLMEEFSNIDIETVIRKDERKTV